MRLLEINRKQFFVDLRLLVAVNQFFFLIVSIGVVVAVFGQEEKDGEFLVKDVMVAGLPPQKPLPNSGVSYDFVGFVI